MRMISCFFLFLLVCFGCGDESSNQDEIVKDSVEDEIVVETEPEKEIVWEKDGKEMVLIPAGSFDMGDAMNDPEDFMQSSRPVHRVTLDMFYMDIHEVTVGQFKNFVNQSGYNYNLNWLDAGSVGDNYPMRVVSWHEAVAYAEWAGKRLPTEAEWEYAARGGVDGKRYPWGDQPPTIETANYDEIVGETTVVGSYPANGYGLYDMGGNLSEWCQDWFGKDYYSNSPVKNPQGPDPIGPLPYRVLRGASWWDSIFGLRVAVRYSWGPNLRSDTIGFRCVSGLP